MQELAYIHDEQNVPEGLTEVPFLQAFSQGDMDDILNSSSILECDKGDVVLEEGKSAHRIFLLLSGELEVIKNGERLATMSNSGVLFGEMAVLDDEHRTANVVATCKTYCLAIDHKFLEDIRPKEQNPAFYAALYGYIAKVTAERLKATSAELARVERELEKLKAERADA
ncbi:MAG: cyclic nucleotide-binding domain-containing protein [Verrucomicrobiota bacterium]